MSRVYAMSFTAVSVSAIQDLLALYCGASKAIKIHEVELGQITGTTVQNLRVRLYRLPVTVTPGTGGAAGTINLLSPNDTAATVIGRTNDTGQATTSGTLGVLRSDVFNTINGYQYLPPEEDRPICGLSQAFVVSLDAAPSGALVMSGTVVFEELF